VWTIIKILSSEFLVLNGAAKSVYFNEKILCASEEIPTKSISLPATEQPGLKTWIYKLLTNCIAFISICTYGSE